MEGIDHTILIGVLHSETAEQQKPLKTSLLLRKPMPQQLIFVRLNGKMIVMS